MDPVNNNSCFTRVSANIHDSVIAATGTIKSRLTSLTSYLPTFQSLTLNAKQQGKQWVIAKVLPFSNTSDRIKKKKEIQRKLGRLKFLKTQIKKDIKRKGTSSNHNTKLQDITKMQEIILKKLECSIEEKEALEKHLDLLWKSEVAARLAGTAGFVATAAVGATPIAALTLTLVEEVMPQTGLISDAIIPTPATIVTQCIQAVAISADINNTQALPEGVEKEASMLRAQKRILFTVASIINTIVIGYLFQAACSDRSGLYGLCSALPGK